MAAGVRSTDRPSIAARIRAEDLALAPNLLSLARLPLAALFPIVVPSVLGALGVLAAAGLTDVLDGYLARKNDQATATGAIVDPVCDKVFAVTVLVTLLTRNLLPAWAIPALLAREILETPLALWIVAKRRQRGVRETMANAPGKLATFAQFVAVLCAIAWRAALTPAVVVAAICGVGAGLSYWQRELARVRQKS